ncbi:hypothetical protein ABVT39_010117 [Epinephelus coioides]
MSSPDLSGRLLDEVTNRAMSMMSIQWFKKKNKNQEKNGQRIQKGINSEPIFLKLWQLASHNTDLPLSQLTSEAYLFVCTCRIKLKVVSAADDSSIGYVKCNSCDKLYKHKTPKTGNNRKASKMSCRAGDGGRCLLQIKKTDTPPEAVEEHPPTLCCDYCISQTSDNNRNSSIIEVEVEVDEQRVKLTAASRGWMQKWSEQVKEST